MEIQYKKEAKIMSFEFERMPKELIEKKFIIGFFEELPIEYLKILINYKEINYNDQNQWKVGSQMCERLSQLRSERAILIEATISLDNGENK